jgi:hypothetical protein
MTKPITRRKNLEHYRKMERIRQARARQKRRDFISRIKTELGCIQCGEKHPSCLQFHHLDPSQKSFTISRAIGIKRPLHIIQSEISKCEVLCANCHAKKHWKENIIPS